MKKVKKPVKRIWYFIREYSKPGYYIMKHRKTRKTKKLYVHYPEEYETMLRVYN